MASMRGLSLESAKLRPEDLLYARFDSPALKTFTEQLQQAGWTDSR